MLSWREPENAKGPFVATVQIDGPFKIEGKSYDLKALADIALRKERLRLLLTWGSILAVFAALAVLPWLARKRWPVIVVVLYASWVTVVFMPIVFFIAACLGGGGGPNIDDIPDFFLGLYGQAWPFWIFCAVLVLSEMFLLIIPVGIVKQRPKPQRGLWATAVAAGALFAIVALGMVWSVVAAVWGDDSIERITFLVALIFLLVNWVAWSCIFRAFARNADPGSYIRKLMKWLLRGTILELLIAVPSHVIVRHKDVCCAHGITAVGIATGLTVMLMSFGPGIYFLYAERIQSRKPRIGNPKPAPLEEKNVE